MEIKDAMEIYFYKQRDFWQLHYGSYPKLPYHKAMNKCMLIPNTLDKKGCIQWKPVLQEVSVDFSELEARINLEIHPQIKQYFTSYWFLSLIGEVGDITLSFLCIPHGIDILHLVEEQYKLGKYNFPNDVWFGFGSANVGKGDGYIIYVDNKTAMVNCVQLWENIVIEIGTLEEVISLMEVGT